MVNAEDVEYFQEMGDSLKNSKKRFLAHLHLLYTETIQGGKCKYCVKMICTGCKMCVFSGLSLEHLKLN